MAWGGRWYVLIDAKHAEMMECGAGTNHIDNYAICRYKPLPYDRLK